MTKLCPKCNTLRHNSEFNWKVRNKKLATYCKVCSREYIKNHYYQNKEHYLEKVKKRNLELRKKSLKYIGEYLNSNPCIDCGESDILVLEFDHKDRSTKIDEVSIIIKKRLSLKRLIAEISKCEVRCANCHRRKTAREDNSWKLKYAPVA